MRREETLSRGPKSGSAGLGAQAARNVCGRSLPSTIAPPIFRPVSLSFRSRRGLYAIVDPERCHGRDLVALAEAILRGGCAMLQLRAKHASDRDRLTWMRALRERAHAHGVPFIVNDRPDLAVLASADGLHLGQDDLPIAEARKIVGSMPIGLSTHRESEVRAAVLAGADMIGFGPVFETKSKENPDPTVGVARLSAVVRISSVPVVAIGGIAESNAALVRETGVPLSACISALGEADDPETAARMLHRALGGAS